MSIKCGKCHDRHETVQQVRACHKIQVQADGATTLTEYAKASPKQIRFIHNLLRRANAKLVDGTPEQVGRSYMIDELLDHLNGGRPLPAWARLDAGKQSADGDPEGYGDPQATHEPLPAIPEGGYAFPSSTGKNDLDFFWVKIRDKGRWKGYTFIDRVVGGGLNGLGKRLPMSVAQQIEVRKMIAALSEEAQDAAGILYGRKMRQCYFCRRSLTDKISRYNGRGPDCAEDRDLAQEIPPDDWDG